MIPSFDMLHQYAPNVAPQTIVALIKVESGGNQFAIGVNGRIRIRVRPKSVKEAVTVARALILKGYSVDLGLMQINNHNLPGLGVTIEQAFDPSANVKAGAQILTRGYRGAIKRYGPGQDALKAALSAYNTGNYERGFKNGYVAKYYSLSNGARDATSIAVNVPTSRYKLVILPKATLPVKDPPTNPYQAGLSIYKMEESSSAIPVQRVHQPGSGELDLADSDLE